MQRRCDVACVQIECLCLPGVGGGNAIGKSMISSWADVNVARGARREEGAASCSIGGGGGSSSSGSNSERVE